MDERDGFFDLTSDLRGLWRHGLFLRLDDSRPALHAMSWTSAHLLLTGLFCFLAALWPSACFSQRTRCMHSCPSGGDLGPLFYFATYPGVERLVFLAFPLRLRLSCSVFLRVFASSFIFLFSSLLFLFSSSLFLIYFLERASRSISQDRFAFFHVPCLVSFVFLAKRTHAR